MSIALRIFKWTLYLGITLGFVGGIAAGGYLWHLSQDLPQNLEAELHKRNDILPTVLYDREGNQVDELFLQRRIVIPYESFPPHLVQALMASEDSRFFSHNGIDPIRMIKAAVENVQAGGFVQGASTLTQQTARLFLLTQDKKLVRKLREILLALRMEQQFEKQQILTLYLNKVFFGNAEGVEASAQGYFGKHTEELTLAESALLVGLLPAPSRYNPHRNPDLALEQRNLVLRRMAEERFISQQELREATAEPIKLTKIHDATLGATAHYIEHVRRYLIDKYGYDTLYQGGLKVHLAMDLDYQLSAQEALRKGLEDLTQRQGFRGPVTTLTPQEDGRFSETQIAQALAGQPLLLGAIVRGVVMKLDEENELAHLRLRDGQQGVLRWEHLKAWKRRWDAEQEIYVWVRELKDMLAVGEVVNVRLDDYDFTNRRFRLQLHQAPKVNGAITAMDPHTGEVLAMSGGYDYESSEFNRAIQAERQPGSAFKPVVYAAALDAGYTLNSRLVDSPRAYKTANRIRGEQEIWTPKNYGNKLMGSVTMRTALVKSLNLPTIGLVEDLGPQNLIDYSRKLGISAQMDRNLTIGLGSFSVTLQEMLGSYAAFANQGQLVEPIFVTRVEDSKGEILEENRPARRQVIPAETAFLITDTMRDVVDHGTGRRALAIGRPSAGKTGTTNDSRDAWYIGYIPQLLTGVYVGYDTPRSMGRYETGSRAAAPIWVDFMKDAVAKLPTEQFPQPPGVITVKVHESGRRAAPCDATKETFYEHYRAGTEPAADNVLDNLCDSQNRIAASEAEVNLEL
jgi:penicillin-binding protein 1A